MHAAAPCSDEVGPPPPEQPAPRSAPASLAVERDVYLFRNDVRRPLPARQLNCRLNTSPGVDPAQDASMFAPALLGRCARGATRQVGRQLGSEGGIRGHISSYASHAYSIQTTKQSAASTTAWPTTSRPAGWMPRASVGPLIRRNVDCRLTGGGSAHRAARRPAHPDPLLVTVDPHEQPKVEQCAITRRLHQLGVCPTPAADP